MDAFFLIHRLLDSEGLSRRQLSVEIGMSPSYLRSLLSGRHYAKPDVAMRLAKRLVEAGLAEESEQLELASQLVGIETSSVA